jgi:hypothetical protein
MVGKPWKTMGKPCEMVGKPWENHAKMIIYIEHGYLIR